MTFAKFPDVSPSAWRAQVEKELAGKPFEKALVHRTLEGIAVAPLYTEAPPVPRVFGDGAPFRICMRHGPDAAAADVLEDLEGGADALWLPRAAAGALPARVPPGVLVLVDEDDDDDQKTCSIGGERASLVSTLRFHMQGADACDEIALALATTVARLAEGAESLVVRVAAGRDTFVELCKIRALRIALRKVLAAAGAHSGSAGSPPSGAVGRGGAPLPLWIHAVASPRTIAARDPWVNMLRVTTELFAAVLGGADLVTPLPFDAGLAPPSALGRRVARNTGHVLREESALGRVVDPGAGSYYLDTLTDVIAREAWERFRVIERAGGIAKAVADGLVQARLGAADHARRDAIAKRTFPVLGVSEFANLSEALPGKPRLDEESALRDGAAFEALRARADALPRERTGVLLATVGPASESRARAGFATALFAAGGMRARELREGERAAPGAIACICGADERYATDAVPRARALREEGCRHVLLAGRPGPTGGSGPVLPARVPLEADLRAAGVDAFLFLGCDVVAVLTPLLEVLS